MDLGDGEHEPPVSVSRRRPHLKGPSPKKRRSESGGEKLKEVEDKTLDDFTPVSEEEFIEYGKLISEKLLRPYEKKCQYIILVGSLMNLSMSSLKSEVASKVTYSAAAIFAKKLQGEKEDGEKIVNDGSVASKKNVIFEHGPMDVVKELWLKSAMNPPSDMSIETFKPESARDFVMYAGLVCAKYLRLHEKNSHYTSLLESVLADSVSGLKSQVAQEVVVAVHTDAYQKELVEKQAEEEKEKPVDDIPDDEDDAFYYSW